MVDPSAANPQLQHDPPKNSLFSKLNRFYLHPCAACSSCCLSVSINTNIKTLSIISLNSAQTASAAADSLNVSRSYISCCVMGGHACRSSIRSWKSSQTRAASSSSRKRARLFSSVSTSSICTCEEGGRDKSAAAETHTH